MNRIVAGIVICGILVCTTSAAVALAPTFVLPKAMQAENLNITPPQGPPTISDACPATDLGTISGALATVGSTAGSADDFDASAWGCGDNAGGPDQIFQFAVDATGFWEISTCDTATFDTSLGLYEDLGGGCPGTFVDCNGDGPGCGGFTSLLQTGLTAGSTYYIVVDGWSTYTYGDFELNITNISCSTDADCDDGDTCNGLEICDVGTGECGPGPSPCLLHQTCDPVTNSCIDPDPCLTYRAGASSNFFFPQANNCPTANLTFDDIQTSKHTTDVLDNYVVPFIGRDFAGDPQGSVFLVDLSLWTVEDGSCNPLAVIAGSECTEPGTIKAGGSPADLLTCNRMVSLPNNDGDFNKCEIDFFIGSSTATQGAGWSIAGEQETIGGPGARDDFGVDVFWIEGCPADGSFGATFFGDDVNTPADFANVTVCQKPAGTCCATDGSCSITNEDDCTAAGGVFGDVGTITDGPVSCEGDVDGDGLDGVCGDNCPNDANPGQEDCNSDGVGDACEPDAANQDGDADGVCNGVDNCPFSANADQADGDGDGVGDVCDPCPLDNPDDTDGDGACDSDDLCPGFNDADDADGDGVPDGCDVCPGNDDNAMGAQDDDDGDGVINCNDLCNGVDDAVFGPECDGAIPTVSEWGLVILALLLLVAGKVYFGRRESLA